MLSRRSFFARLAAAAAAAKIATETEIDPERLLWVPGQKTIFIPEAPRIRMAEDVAVEQIREEFKKPRIIDPELRIYRPADMPSGGYEPASTYRGYDGRYTLTVPDGRGGTLSQNYNSDWSRNGGVQHRSRSFEPNRAATREEAAEFNFATQGRRMNERPFEATKAAFDRRMFELDSPADTLRRYKEKG